MEKDKVQNDKVQPDDEISNEDLDKVAGGTKNKSSIIFSSDDIKVDRQVASALKKTLSRK